VVARKTEDHLRLITDINEITSLLSDSPDLQGFLDRAVVMVAEHLSADVCSIYLYDEKANLLTLSATCGLSQKAVGEIQLKPGEGLVGRSLKELRPICVANASSSPDYKFFPE
jgi:phosphotransferase system enzyme I (PtsP)